MLFDATWVQTPLLQDAPASQYCLFRSCQPHFARHLIAETYCTRTVQDIRTYHRDKDYSSRAGHVVLVSVDGLCGGLHCRSASSRGGKIRHPGANLKARGAESATTRTSDYST